MPRAISPANLNAAKQTHVMPVVFAKLEFDSGTLYVHNSVGPLLTLGQTWLGMGNFSNVEGVEEGAELSPYAVRLGLSALDPTLLAADLNESYWGRGCTLYQGWLNPDTEQLVDDPDPLWAGNMDDMSLSMGNGENGDVILLTAESEFSRIDAANNSLFAHVEQQQLFPGDLFFSYLAETVDAKPRWGVNAQAGAGSSPYSLTPRAGAGGFN